MSINGNGNCNQMSVNEADKMSANTGKMPKIKVLTWDPKLSVKDNEYLKIHLDSAYRYDLGKQTDFLNSSLAFVDTRPIIWTNKVSSRLEES